MQESVVRTALQAYCCGTNYEPIMTLLMQTSSHVCFRAWLEDFEQTMPRHNLSCMLVCRLRARCWHYPRRTGRWGSQALLLKDQGQHGYTARHRAPPAACDIYLVTVYDLRALAMCSVGSTLCVLYIARSTQTWSLQYIRISFDFAITTK